MSTEAETLVSTLRERRAFLRQTLDGMTEEQAAARSTVSQLCLGGLVKHVAVTEAAWAGFIREGAPAMERAAAETQAAWEDAFAMLPGETVDGVLARYADVAAATDALVMETDLDSGHPLPEAPWFPRGVSWSARRVVLHMIGETAQHAGHADIIREAIDGAKTMG